MLVGLRWCTGRSLPLLITTGNPLLVVLRGYTGGSNSKVLVVIFDNPVSYGRRKGDRGQTRFIVHDLHVNVRLEKAIVLR